VQAAKVVKKDPAKGVFLSWHPVTALHTPIATVKPRFWPQVPKSTSPLSTQTQLAVHVAASLNKAKGDFFPFTALHCPLTKAKPREAAPFPRFALVVEQGGVEQTGRP
jgi:hypothetical protein